MRFLLKEGRIHTLDTAKLVKCDWEGTAMRLDGWKDGLIYLL